MKTKLAFLSILAATVAGLAQSSSPSGAAGTAGGQDLNPGTSGNQWANSNHWSNMPTNHWSNGDTNSMNTSTNGYHYHRE
jgi:hypothetical protein